MYGLTQTLAIFVYKGPDSKYFRLYGVIRSLCQFRRVPITKYPKSGDLNQQKFILLILEARSMELWCQKSHAPSEILGRICSMRLSGFCWLLAALGITRLVSISASILTWPLFSFVILCIQMPLFSLYKETSH